MVKANEPGLIDKLKSGEFVGVVDGLSNFTYHGLDKYWSSTQLKYLLDTSSHQFKRKYVDKDLEKESATSRMLIGSAVHSLLLDLSNFRSDFLVMPPLNLRTKSGREERDKLLKTYAHKMVLTEEQFGEAQLMAQSVLENERARKVLGGTVKELSIFWKCAYSGLNFKAKLDALGDRLVELKTTDSGRKDDFEKQSYDMNYDLSLWHYMTGINASPELKRTDQATFVVVENSSPYISEVYEVHESMISVGQAKWLQAVDQLADGVIRGYWPGYVRENNPDSQILVPPQWGLRKWVPDYGIEKGV